MPARRSPASRPPAEGCSRRPACPNSSKRNKGDPPLDSVNFESPGLEILVTRLQLLEHKKGANSETDKINTKHEGGQLVVGIVEEINHEEGPEEGSGLMRKFRVGIPCRRSRVKEVVKMIVREVDKEASITDEVEKMRVMREEARVDKKL
ncbi:hypothetical protein KIL84_003739 [Mauremys mutica]|uniref:Uncharacterized protein n=1 Tax=Mauremys mutica TaxID=74926 RepID=A0A9D4ATS9_9SAUR|nr:hypothetical protein KIL84_003739 [Mauremys mutica]